MDIFVNCLGNMDNLWQQSAGPNASQSESPVIVIRVSLVQVNVMLIC